MIDRLSPLARNLALLAHVLDDDATALPALLGAAPAERQLARRSGVWHALRLEPSPSATGAMMSSETFEAGLGQAGTLDSLRWQATADQSVRADEVGLVTTTWQP